MKAMSSDAVHVFKGDTDVEQKKSNTIVPKSATDAVREGFGYYKYIFTSPPSDETINAGILEWLKHDGINCDVKTKMTLESPKWQTVADTGNFPGIYGAVCREIYGWETHDWVYHRNLGRTADPSQKNLTPKNTR